MELHVTVEGLDRIGNASAAVRQAIAGELLKAMQASTSRVEQEAKRSITRTQKTGRIYKRRTVVHQASAAGEPPANDTGLLLQSIRGHVDRNALRSGLLEGKVGVGVDYGKFLEFGTSEMAARPFLHPAFERSKNWIRDRFNKAVRDGAIKSTKP